MIEIQKKSIRTDNGVVEFELNIETVIINGSRMYVLLELPHGELANIYRQNLYAFENGKIIWQMEDASKIISPYYDMGFLHMDILDDGNIIVKDFCGRRCIVNSENGKIIGKAPTCEW